MKTIQTIRKLDRQTISKIAAGEVINRPMNIVKELVENAIDADANQIHVTIHNGGLRQVMVQDNGSGIPKADLELAFQLHTTSKLAGDAISEVSSLGFRGEALASISSVSLVECTTRTKQDSLASHIVLEGGETKSLTEVNAEPGTTITVKSIFFNTPARKKFLKSASTERKRIIDLITQYGLTYPEIHFKLSEITSSQKHITRMESPSRKTLLASIFDLLGHEIASNLVDVQGAAGNWNVEGYISTPTLTRSDRTMQFISVNGRPVYHLEIQKTVEEAYQSQLMKRKHPFVILHFTGSIDGVDFNVHPQKLEVQFSNSDTLLNELPEVIQNALKQSAQVPSIEQVQKKQQTKQSPDPARQANLVKPQDTDQDTSYIFSDSEISTAPKTVQRTLFDETVIDGNGAEYVLGHIFNKFGVLIRGNELWLVDIHAADERVKFELYAKSSHRQASSQQLLSPLPIALTTAEVLLLEENSQILHRFGLKISKGGSTSILIHAVPVYYDQEITAESIKTLLIDMVAYLNEDTTTTPVESPFNKIEYALVSRLACHGAVRSGYPISREKVKTIISDLLDCDYPWTCAHGRPTVIRMSKKQLESMFKR